MRFAGPSESDPARGARPSRARPSARAAASGRLPTCRRHAASRRAPALPRAAAVVATAVAAAAVAAPSAGAMVNGTAATASGSTVALRIEGPKSAALCTGTLIAPSVVLTAAHCVDGQFDRVRVLAGVLDRTARPAPADDFVVTRVQESRDFEKGSKTTKPSDLAYLELGRSSTQEVAGVSLAAPKAGVDVRSRGYGTIDENADGTVPASAANVLLREAKVRVVACAKGGYADVFCTSYAKSSPKAGPCRGDSGGPVLKASSNVLIGVYSGTPKGCRGVSSYADLAQHDAFLVEALKPRLTGRVFDLPAASAAIAGGARPDDARVAAKLPGAVVKARRQDGTLASSTPIVNGRFTLPVGKKGVYDLEVIAKGFVTSRLNDVSVQGPRGLDAGLTPGTSIVPGASSGPQEVSVVRATRHPKARLAVDVAVNPPPGASRKVAVTITAPAKGGKVAHKAGSKTFTATRPIARETSFDITSALASRLQAGDQVRVTVTLDGVFVREQTLTIAKPSKGSGPTG